MTTTSRRAALLGAFGTVGSVVLAACGGGRQAATEPVATPEPAVAGGTLGLGIVGLAVADLGASLAFYRRLGLAIPRDVDTSAGAFRLRLPNDTIFFWETLSYVRDFDPNYRRGTGDRKVMLEFGFSSASDVDAMYENLVASGSQGYFAPVSWSNGAIRYAIVVDPDDNQVSLRWPLVS